MVLDNNQTSNLLYKLDVKKFLDEIVKKKKVFHKKCKDDPETLRVILEGHLNRLVKYQKQMEEPTKVHVGFQIRTQKRK